MFDNVLLFNLEEKQKGGCRLNLKVGILISQICRTLIVKFIYFLSLTNVESMLNLHLSLAKSVLRKILFPNN